MAKLRLVIDEYGWAIENCERLRRDSFSYLKTYIKIEADAKGKFKGYISKLKIAWRYSKAFFRNGREITIDGRISRLRSK